MYVSGDNDVGGGNPGDPQTLGKSHRFQAAFNDSGVSTTQFVDFIRVSFASFLITILPQAAMEVVILLTSAVFSYKNLIKMKIFPFECRFRHMI